jgi:hypothetical protein
VRASGETSVRAGDAGRARASRVAQEEDDGPPAGDVGESCSAGCRPRASPTRPWSRRRVRKQPDGMSPGPRCPSPRSGTCWAIRNRRRSIARSKMVRRDARGIQESKRGSRGVAHALSRGAAIQRQCRRPTEHRAIAPAAGVAPSTLITAMMRSAPAMPGSRTSLPMLASDRSAARMLIQCAGTCMAASTTSRCAMSARVRSTAQSLPWVRVPSVSRSRSGRPANQKASGTECCSLPQTRNAAPVSNRFGTRR